MSNTTGFGVISVGTWGELHACTYARTSGRPVWIGGAVGIGYTARNPESSPTESQQIQ